MLRHEVSIETGAGTKDLLGLPGKMAGSEAPDAGTAVDVIAGLVVGNTTEPEVAMTDCTDAAAWEVHWA